MVSHAELISQLRHYEDFGDMRTLKRLNNDLRTHLHQAFSTQPVSDLVAFRANITDQVLCAIWWQLRLQEQPGLALIAVGGYGREELHPNSDIDILILSTKPLAPEINDMISRFITTLWDSKYEVGHSVRTVKDCIKLAKKDITIATNLIEARILAGDESLLHDLKAKMQERRFWPSKDFFIAKRQEQQARHGQFHGIAYNLEPNLKSSPGGLRDIQTITWVAKRHFDVETFAEMVKNNFITDEELRELLECREYLWRMRFALHLVAGRSEDRLLFDYQPNVAALMGFGTQGKIAVERMMKRYFRVVKRVGELNKMLLQHFEYVLLDKRAKVKVLDEDYQIVGELIQARHDKVYVRHENIITLFQIIADHPEIQDIHSDTLRLLRNARRRLSEGLSDYEKCREAFIALMRHPRGVGLPFTLMHNHGVISTYLPQWRHIVGLMQFDLFHAYTVDEHTHRLMQNLHDFRRKENASEFPVCSNILQRMQKPELLYLAGIFHDIAKGRGGDHSKLGAVDAYEFCRFHNLSEADSKLVAWIVENHLLMSTVAQRKDISDPEVVREFAEQVRDELRLNYLYCLTVADIRATNDNLWNNWKASLLRELYFSTQAAYRRGLEKPVNVRQRIRENQLQALNILESRKVDLRKVERLWKRFKADYFVRNSAEQIAWQADNIVNSKTDKVVSVNNHLSQYGGTEIFVYCEDRRRLFSGLVATLDSKMLTIYDAKVMATKDGFAVDSFIVLDRDGDEITSATRQKDIELTLKDFVENDTPIHYPKRKMPRKMRQFSVKTQINFFHTKKYRGTLMELFTLDRPGLLTAIANIFEACDLKLKNAKITTIGERVEDTFLLSDLNGDIIDNETQLKVKTAIKQKLEELST